MTQCRLVGFVLTLVIATCAAAGDDGPVAPTSSPGTLKVMCWNVLYAFNHGNSVDEGVAYLAARKPDVLALQELNGHTQASLAALARRWGHDHAAIHKESGFPVGLTSTEPIEVLERRVEGFHHGYLHARTHGIHFFVVHFWPEKDHEAQIVLERIAPLLERDEDVIVLGDFNTHSRKDVAHLATTVRTPRYAVVDMVEGAGFVDLVHKHDKAAVYSCPSPVTIPRWSKDMEEVVSKRARIDFVFASGKLAKASRSGTIEVSDALGAISDHYPLVVEFVVIPEAEAAPGNPARGSRRGAPACVQAGTPVRPAE
jgi:exodeoxyribonuclease-3